MADENNLLKPSNQQYQPYQPQQGYGTSAGYPAPSSCTMCREDLEHQLNASGYGANAAMFNCYFFKEAPEAPPRCVACRRLVGEHPSRGPGAPMATPVVGVFDGVAPATAAALPNNLAVGDTTDVASIPVSKGLFIVICILGFIAAVQFIAFFASGLVSNAPFCLIGPCILILISAVFILTANTFTVTFMKCSGAMGPNTPVVVTKRYLLGCSNERQTSVQGLGTVTMRSTNVRVNRQYIYEVVAVSPMSGDNCATPLFRGYYFEAAQQLASWQAYFARYGVASSGAAGVILPIVVM